RRVRRLGTVLRARPIVRRRRRLPARARRLLQRLHRHVRGRARPRLPTGRLVGGWAAREGPDRVPRFGREPEPMASHRTTARGILALLAGACIAAGPAVAGPSNLPPPPAG